MKYEVKVEDRYAILKVLEGTLDSTVAPDLKAELISKSVEGIKNIILDLSEVNYTDSSGLSAILAGNRICNAENGIFIVASPSEHVIKLIKISQLDKVLYIVPTIEESIEAVFMNDLENEFGELDEED